MTRLLAFDTSTQAMSVALTLPGEVLVYDGEGGAAASSQLIARALALLSQAGMGWSQLDAIAFGRGPGAFTGLRTACAVAQGLALGADRPVLPLDSLMVVAHDACVSQGAGAMHTLAPLWVAIDARMCEVYAAQYQWQAAPAGSTAGHWRVRTAPLLSQPQSLLDQWAASPPEGLAGNALLAFAEVFSQPALLPALPRFAHAQVRAQALAAVAQQTWAQGGAVDAALALPLYVRDKVAQTTAEREAARSAAAALGAP